MGTPGLAREPKPSGWTESPRSRGRENSRSRSSPERSRAPCESVADRPSTLRTRTLSRASRQRRFGRLGSLRARTPRRFGRSPPSHGGAPATGSVPCVPGKPSQSFRASLFAPRFGPRARGGGDAAPNIIMPLYEERGILRSRDGPTPPSPRPRLGDPDRGSGTRAANRLPDDLPGCRELAPYPSPWGGRRGVRPPSVPPRPTDSAGVRTGGSGPPMGAPRLTPVFVRPRSGTSTCPRPIPLRSTPRQPVEWSR